MVTQLLVIVMKEEDKRDSLGVDMMKARKVTEILTVSNGQGMSVYSMVKSRDSLEA